MKMKFTPTIGVKNMHFAEKIINGLIKVTQSAKERKAIKTIYLAALEKGAIPAWIL